MANRVSLSGTLLASAVRTATQTKTLAQIIGTDNLGNAPPNIQDFSAAEFFLNVTAVPGVDTVQLVLSYIDPLTGQTIQIAATTATAATGLVMLKVAPGVTAVAASTTKVVVNDIMSKNWQIQVVHSAASNFTYSLSYNLFD